MYIETTAFKHQEPIPKKYTCAGENISPPLFFRDIPVGTKSLALIMDDPDAPHGVFDHWITWNIPANRGSLPEGVRLEYQGSNSYNKQKYNGPCPPPGKPHRYFFKLYALKETISLPKGATKAQLEEVMEEIIIEKAELIGTYQKEM